ncbi:MAG: hypothetical protein AAF754_05195 [Pseudomonadota bacterium]
MQNDLIRLTDEASVPFSFCAPTGSKIIVDSAEITCAFRSLRTQLQNAGVIRLEPEVLVIEQQTDQRCAFQARWTYFKSEMDVFSRSLTRYVVKRDREAGRFRMELVEYLSASFPDVVESVLVKD